MKLLLLLADPKRSITICLSEDSEVVSVALVGEAFRFAVSSAHAPQTLPPGYWEFCGGPAENIVASLDMAHPAGVLSVILFHLPEVIA